MKKLLFSLFVLIFASCNSQDNSFEDDNKINFVTVNKVPVVKGTLNGKEAFFIVDSGASVSVLDDSQSEYFDFSIFPSDSEAAGYGGIAQFGEASEIDLFIGGKKFNTDFKTQDLSAIVELIRENDNIDISGIIGSDIMKTYHFIIDYSNLSISIAK
jgi:hypothetical protein